MFFCLPLIVSDAVTQMMISAIVVGSILLIVIGYLFIRRIPYIIRHTPSNYLARTLMLCGVYTITASAAFVSLIVYRASVFCDSVCHFAFLLCAYQYFTLAVSYVGGESNFIKTSEGMTVFNIRTPPFCCCLRFLLPTAMTKYVNRCDIIYMIRHFFFAFVLMIFMLIFAEISSEFSD